MKKTACRALFLMLTSFALAQDSPRAEVFGGYSYLNFDFNGSIPRQSFHGWEAAAAWNVNDWLAVEGDVSGYYKSLTVTGNVLSTPVTVSGKVHGYRFLAGPRINFGPAFLHLLYGVDHLSGTAFSSSASDNSFSLAMGGGIQKNVRGPWGVRVSGDFVPSRHNLLGSSKITQSNFRVSVGIVYRFGIEKPAVAVAPAGMTIPSLGIRVAPRDNAGAQITEVTPNSVAALAGLRVRDIINSVDGKAVKSPADLAAELSNRPPGTSLRLGYLIRGYYQTEKLIAIH